MRAAAAIPLPTVRPVVIVAIVVVRTAEIMRTAVTVRPARPEAVRPWPAGPGATSAADTAERGDDRLHRIRGLLLVGHGESIYVT